MQRNWYANESIGREIEIWLGNVDGQRKRKPKQTDMYIEIKV